MKPKLKKTGRLWMCEHPSIPHVFRFGTTPDDAFWAWVHGVAVHYGMTL